VISIRKTRDLPNASFRFYFTIDTLAFGYVLIVSTTSALGTFTLEIMPMLGELVKDSPNQGAFLI